MLRFALRRALLALAVGLAVSAIAFLLLRVSGDLAAALAGEDAPAAEVERIRAQFGLDRPLALQYLQWLGRALMGEVAAARFQSLCSAMGVECVVQ